jgi:thiol-disulfide isomerase/thioredoxin
MLKKPRFGLWVYKAALQTGAFIGIFILLSAAVDSWRGRELPVSNIPKGPYIDIEGKSVDIAALSQDGLVIVYFWATWCGPCKLTSPSIQQLAKHYPVVTVAMASGADDDLKNYAADNSPQLAIINDDNQSISKQWRVAVTPTVLFVKSGAIAGYTMGASGYPGLRLRAWWAKN